MHDHDIIQSVPRDSIPAIRDPSFGEGYVGDPDDRVFVLDPETGPARAYPNRILWYHEIVNDVVDASRDGAASSPGTPVLVAWCEICGSAAAYERRVDGRTLTFGQRGKLADDNMVLYDHETDSEWKQSAGRAIAGPLAGERLSPVPLSMLTWAQFRDEYPDGVVLQPVGGVSKKSGDGPDPGDIDYGEDGWDIGYLSSDAFGRYAVYDLISAGPVTEYDPEADERVAVDDDHPYATPRTWDRDDVAPKDVVLGLEFGDDALAVPQSVLDANDGAVAVTVADRDVVVLATDVSEAYPFPRAYADPGYEFAPADDPNVYRADGARWNALTGRSDDGRTLDALPGKRLFAFAWQDDHGPDSFLV